MTDPLKNISNNVLQILLANEIGNVRLWVGIWSEISQI